jgi:hypothetical protein
VIGSIDEIVQIDYRLKKNLIVSLNNVELYDDKYDFFEETLKQKYSEIDKITTNFGLRDLSDTEWDLICHPDALSYCEEYISILIFSSGDLITMKRTYPKIFNVIGELGGFIDIVMLVFGILYIASKIQKDTEQIKKALLGRLFKAERENLEKAVDTEDKKLAEKKLKSLEETEEEILEEA